MTQTPDKWLCVESDLGNVSGRCAKQCAECRDIEKHERTGTPPEEGPCPYDLNNAPGYRHE
jgi:hypothetical protein